MARDYDEDPHHGGNGWATGDLSGKIDRAVQKALHHPAKTGSVAWSIAKGAGAVAALVFGAGIAWAHWKDLPKQVETATDLGAVHERRILTLEQMAVEQQRSNAQAEKSMDRIERGQELQTRQLWELARHTAGARQIVAPRAVITTEAP